MPAWNVLPCVLPTWEAKREVGTEPSVIEQQSSSLHKIFYDNFLDFRFEFMRIYRSANLILFPAENISAFTSVSPASFLIEQTLQ